MNNLKRFFVLSAVLMLVFLSGRLVTSVLAESDDDGGWINVGTCVANQCGSSVGTQNQSKTTTTRVCDKDCPTVTFNASHLICPTNDSAYTSDNHDKPCSRVFGTGQSRHTKYADKITETFTKTFKYDKSEDPNHCHKPTPDSLNIPTWARDDYGKLQNELSPVNNENSCHNVTTTETRTISCETAPNAPCAPAGQCPTQCGQPASRVDDGKGGFISCDATPACVSAGECPTACGQQATEVADGKGGTKQCGATPACDPGNNNNNNNNNSSGGGSVSAPQCTDKKPSTPQILTITRTSPTTVTLSWAPAVPVTYYSIAYGTDPNNLQFGVPNAGNGTSFSIGALNPNLTYYFVVRGVDNCMPSDPSGVLAAGPRVLGASTSKVLGASTDRLADTSSDFESVRTLVALTVFALSFASGVKFFHAREDK